MRINTLEDINYKYNEKVIYYQFFSFLKDKELKILN